MESTVRCVQRNFKPLPWLITSSKLFPWCIPWSSIFFKFSPTNSPARPSQNSWIYREIKFTHSWTLFTNWGVLKAYRVCLYSTIHARGNSKCFTAFYGKAILNGNVFILGVNEPAACAHLRFSASSLHNLHTKCCRLLVLVSETLSEQVTDDASCLTIQIWNIFYLKAL